MMFQRRVEEDEAWILPDVKAVLVEWNHQEVVGPEEKWETATANEMDQETSDTEVEDGEAVLQVEEPTQ